MSEQTKSWGESWLAAQRAMWQGWLPDVPTQSNADPAAREATPLEEQFNELRDTWQASVRKWTEFARDASRDDLGNPERLREMFAPSTWASSGPDLLDAGLRHVLEGPRYALLWDLDRKLMELQQATLRRDKDIAAYQAVVQKAWARAFERFAKAVSADPANLGKQTWRSLADRWLAIANETLIEVYRTDEFLEAQRSMLRTASDRHLQERRIAEAWCEASHVPTRSEVDELQRQVVELRRELRLLRRAAPTPIASTSGPAGSRPRTKRAAKRARA